MRRERYGEDLLAAVGRGLEVPEGECPTGPPRSRYDRGMERRVDRALECLKERSAAADIDHALVATRAEVKDVLAYARVVSNPSAAHPVE